MALTQDRNTPARTGEQVRYPVAAGEQIFAGSIVVIAADGFAKAGTTATGLRTVGRAAEAVDNRLGEAGDVFIDVDRGVFRYANSEGTDEITQAQVGETAYVVDDETVAKTSGVGTRSPAGIVIDVEDDGVWVQLGYGPVAVGGALLAASNLGDVASAATARANIGANLVPVVVRVPDLSDTAAVIRVVSPVAGKLTAIRSVIDDAITTGDATLTTSIDGAAVTGGVVTIAYDGSAAGDTDVAAPSDDNDVTAGAVIELTVGGTSDAQVGATVTLLIET